MTDRGRVGVSQSFNVNALIIIHLIIFRIRLPEHKETSISRVLQVENVLINVI